MRKKKSKRRKNLLSHMSCNYDATKLHRPLLECWYTHVTASSRGRYIVRALFLNGELSGPVAGFKNRRRAIRLAAQLNALIKSHKLVRNA